MGVPFGQLMTKKITVKVGVEVEHREDGCAAFYPATDR